MSELTKRFNLDYIRDFLIKNKAPGWASDIDKAAEKMDSLERELAEANARLEKINREENQND